MEEADAVVDDVGRVDEAETVDGAGDEPPVEDQRHDAGIVGADVLDFGDVVGGVDDPVEAVGQVRVLDGPAVVGALRRLGVGQEAARPRSAHGRLDVEPVAVQLDDAAGVGAGFEVDPRHAVEFRRGVAAQRRQQRQPVVQRQHRRRRPPLDPGVGVGVGIGVGVGDHDDGQNRQPNPPESLHRRRLDASPSTEPVAVRSLKKKKTNKQKTRKNL